MAEKSFSRLPIFQEPMRLISTSEDGKLQFNQEPMKQIRQIDEPLVVVAIVGLYRTGKSYLLNRLAGSSSGFPLGETIESQTKGIWVWCREHPVKANTVLLLLDTEGLGDVAKGDSNHDNRIFTIAALLSNVLVYNITAVFNQDAVEKLTFITQISNNIRFSNGKDGVDDEELGLILPTFVLCIRDFNLVLEKDGLKITPDAYLEDSLQLKSGDDSSIKKYNMPRKCIRKYFPKRKCFVLDIPGDRKTLQNLESVPSEKLSESFVEEIGLFLDYMYTHGPKVLISSKPINGGMFASLVENYVTAIRNGAVPDVDDAIMVVANIENERMASEAVQIFKQKIEEIQLPILHTNKFEELYRDMQKAALARFRIKSMSNAEKFEKQAVSEMDELWEKIKTENMQLVREHCETLLQGLYCTKLGEKMKRNEYNVAGGYPLYKRDMEAMLKEYRVKVKGIDGYEAQQVLVTFLDKEAEIESNMMFEDQKMTQEDRQRELERIHIEHQEAQESQEKLFESTLNEEKDRAELHQRKMEEEERNECVRRQEEKMTAIKNEWNAQRKLSEKQLQMMLSENAAKKKAFQEQVSRLTEEHKRKEQENQNWFDDMIQYENIRVQQQLDDVTDKFQNMLEEEKRLSSNMESNRKTQKRELENEKSRRKEMKEEYERQMDAYARRINALKERVDEKDAEMKAEIKILERERNEYRNKASRSGCHIM